MKQIYRFRFARTVPPRDIEDTLMLALMAVESLHGRVRLRMDGCYTLDKEQRLCEIDASSRVGADLAEIFTGYATREYGDDAVTIQQETVQDEMPDKCSHEAAAPAGANA